MRWYLGRHESWVIRVGSKSERAWGVKRRRRKERGKRDMKPILILILILILISEEIEKIGKKTENLGF